MITTPSGDDLDRLAVDDPDAARAITADLLAGEGPFPAEDEVRWCTARTMASLRVGAIDDAADAVDRGLRVARATGDDEAVLELRRLRSGVLTESGRTEEALAELDELAELVTEEERGAVLFSRATVLLIAGRMSEARDAYGAALPLLEQVGDRMRIATLHLNRANTHRTTGDLERAERDLRAASQLFGVLGSAHPERTARIHLAALLAGGGRIAAALAELEQVRSDEPAFALDEGHVLLDAHLLDEARSVFRRAAEGFVAGGQRNYAGAALVGAARAELLLGESAAARATAAAVHELVEVGSGHAIEASIIEQLAAAGGEVDAPSIARLDAAGRADVADGLRVRLALERLETGRLDDVAALATPVVERSAGTLSHRLRRHLAAALIAAADGRDGAARRSVSSGLAVLAHHQAALGAVDLRAEAQGHGEALARLGLRLTATTSPIEMLLASERSRAGSSRLPRPPVADDPELGALLTRLRTAQRRADEGDAEDRARVSALREVRELERAVAARRRSRPGASGAAIAVDRERLRAASRSVSMVSFVELDAELHRLDLVDGRCRRTSLGPTAAIAEPARGLARALERLADRRLRPAMVHTRRRALSHDGRALAELLLGGCVLDRPTVIVPTGPLHGFPWSALPPLRSAPFVLASSLTGWLHAEERSSRRAEVGTCAVAGPDLVDAVDEARTIADAAEHGAVVVGEEATGRNVARAMRGARVAHLAAHGRFRGDNPLLSGVELGDGVLTVHDLEATAPTPPTVVLSSCDLARSVVRPGDELLGLAAGLFALGTDSVVAAVQAVPDGSTRSLMERFHGGLERGVTVAQALADARGALLGDEDAGPLDDAAAMAFAVVGAGHGPGRVSIGA
ncbi:MAG: CHAT domain-containing protein [Actinomycetota bacterium]